MRLEIRGISRSYGGHAALVDVRLALPDVRTVALLGPSGSGKSTLLRIIDGLLGPDRGTVHVDGAAVSQPGPDRAMVFQQDSLLPWKTVIENVAYGLTLAHKPRAEAERAGAAIRLIQSEQASAIALASSLKTDVISGEQEAGLAFRGVTSDPRFAREPLLLLDVGGGSAQFILGQGEQIHFQRSYALGSVRLLEKLPPGEPPEVRELAAVREAGIRQDPAADPGSIPVPRPMQRPRQSRSERH